MQVTRRSRYGDFRYGGTFRLEEGVGHGDFNCAVIQRR